MDESIFFLKNEEIKEGFSAKGLLEAKEKLDLMKLPTEQRKAYEAYQDDLHYQASMFESNYGEAYLDAIHETGSASLQSFKDISDSLAGRIGIVELYPLSLKEKQQKKENIIDILANYLNHFILQKASKLDLSKHIIDGVIKSPKIYATDTGILSHLLQINSKDRFENSHFKGHMIKKR